MKSKWFRKKEKEYKPKYEDLIYLRMKTYDYTRGVMKVLDAIKGEYNFDSRAYHRALAYHRRTVVIPEARETRTRYINGGRMFYGMNFKGDQ